MLKIENVITPSHEWMVAVARGMRNSYNSWNKMDTDIIASDSVFGPNDYELAKKLVKAGPSHAKFMRMIPIIFDVTAPLYWWKEMDTYKVGTVRNSCSTMHKITSKEFTFEDFSYPFNNYYPFNNNYPRFDQAFINTIDILNVCREQYVKEKDPVRKKEIWNFLIAYIPSSYNQKSTMTMNYQVLSTIYQQRKNHKLTEWHQFCDWIETLPMHDLITGE